MSLSGLVPDFNQILAWLPDLITIIDLGLVLALSYALLLIIGEGERRSLWMIRGFIILMLATVVSGKLKLELLKFLFEKLVLGSAVAMAVIFQSQFRRLLEQIGRGEILKLFQESGRPKTQPDSVIDRIVEAVKELSQNRTGALILMETTGSLEDEDYVSVGVSLNAEVSKELIQTIFQTTTLLHDGAVVISGSRILAAAAILPLSERTASRQLGTRHRAAMGITDWQDADNLAKLVLDAMQSAGLLPNDSAVWNLEITKVWCKPGREGVKVGVNEWLGCGSALGDAVGLD